MLTTLIVLVSGVVCALGLIGCVNLLAGVYWAVLAYARLANKRLIKNTDGLTGGDLDSDT
jgi:hypothetical protein